MNELKLDFNIYIYAVFIHICVLSYKSNLYTLYTRLLDCGGSVQGPRER